MRGGVEWPPFGSGDAPFLGRRTRGVSQNGDAQWRKFAHFFGFGLSGLRRQTCPHRRHSQAGRVFILSIALFHICNRSHRTGPFEFYVPYHDPLPIDRAEPLAMPPVLWLILNESLPGSRGTNFLELFFSFYFSLVRFVFLSTPRL